MSFTLILLQHLLLLRLMLLSSLAMPALLTFARAMTNAEYHTFVKTQTEPFKIMLIWILIFYDFQTEVKS